jgi:uncharacterized protein (TIGR03032 family)
MTAISDSDVLDGWRGRRYGGGVVLDIDANQIVAAGLSMPHSPRVYRDKLWVLNSGAGYFGSIDLKRGVFEPLTYCPGYLRGLSFCGDYAIVGLSRPRHDKPSERLPPNPGAAEPHCGVQVIDLRRGDCIDWIRFEGQISELYDVAILPGVKRPMALGFKTDEIERFWSVGAG